MQRRCLNCCTRDYRTERGLTLCANCADKAAARERHFTEEQRENRRRKQRERYAKARAEGRCTKCGKPCDKQGKAQCSTCYAREAKRHRDKRAQRPGPHRGDEGICWKCVKNPAAEGYKLCQSCIDKARAAWKKASAPGKDHIWRKLNRNDVYKNLARSSHQTAK